MVDYVQAVCEYTHSDWNHLPRAFPVDGFTGSGVSQTKTV